MMKKISILNSYRIDLNDPIGSSGANIGNSYICFALEKAISPLCIIQDFDKISLDSDLYIINCQDNLRVGNDEPLKLNIDYTKARILSLGINNFPYQQQISFDDYVFKNLKKVSEALPIGVRGEFTRAHLESLGIKSLALGCPTFFLNEYISVKNIDKFPNMSEIIVTGDFSYFDKPGGFFSQGDYDIKVSDYILRYGQFKDGSYTLKNNFFHRCRPPSKIKPKVSHFLTNPAKTNQIFERYKLCIGSRVHASIMAINSGIPAICTNYDFRALEMCSFLGIPHIAFLPPISSPNFLRVLNHKIDNMKLNYAEKKKNYQNYLLNLFSL